MRGFAEEIRELAPLLTPEELEELDRLVPGLPDWRPMAGPQAAAWRSEADILFYGGAAGGGKTDLVLGLARFEHFRSVVFRRVFPSLAAIIDRSHEVYNPDGKNTSAAYNESAHRWRFVDGRAVRFASLQHEKNVTDWQGQPHDLYAFDELPEFTEKQFRFVIGWNRTTRAGQRCRVVCTGNPPTTSDGEWVVRFFAPWLDDTHPNPALPGELRWFTTVKGKDIEVPNGDPVLIDGKLVRPLSRTFIPAKLSDNPILSATDYEARLQALPEPLRSKMLFGDFKAGREDNAFQVIPTEWVLAAQARWKARARPTIPMTAIGVDVARGGKDRTVITPRFGNYFAEQVCHPGKATPDGDVVAAHVMGTRTHDAVVRIDVIGVGTSPFDSLRRLIKGAGKVIAMNGAAGSDALDRTKQLGFYNKRAEWYWRFREALEPKSGQDVALPPDPELRADLTAPTWELTPRGIKVEAKEDIEARIGRSPDKGDSAVYANATDGKPVSFGDVEAPIIPRSW